MKVTVDITAMEKEALRRALAGLYAEERARFPGRAKESRIGAACLALYEKFFETKPE